MWDPKTFRLDGHADDVPPRSCLTNGRRALKAWLLLEGGNYSPIEGKTALTDALADLMHLAHREGWDFDDALSCARHHYQVERQKGFYEVWDVTTER